MRKSMFALLALAISLIGTQCWASTCSNGNTEGVVSCMNTFSPTDTTGTYEFFGNGRLIVQFNTVLTTFMLTATVNHTIDPLDPNEFPAGTVAVTYANGFQDQYDFTGSAGGPNGVPVRNTDYKGLITLVLGYSISTSQIVHNPAFGHAPGDITTITEDILTSYSTSTPTFPDPTMGGTTPGLSSVVALDEPFVESGDSFCSLTLQTAPFQVGQQIEVDYRLTNGTDCSTGIRDKTARFSLSMRDSSVFPALTDKEEANKFHWDNKNKVNEFDLSTVGLAPGTYTINVFSSKISPQSVSFVLAPAP